MVRLLFWLVVVALFAAMAGAASSDGMDRPLNKDYQLISPMVPDDAAQRMAKMDAEARREELEMLQQYERADFNWVKGVVYEEN